MGTHGLTSIRSDANRRNAKASTGPKSEEGKIRSARNSLRHGLAMPLWLDPAWAEKGNRLARELAGGETNPVLWDSGRELAEAYTYLRRIRKAPKRGVSTALGYYL